MSLNACWTKSRAVYFADRYHTSCLENYGTLKKNEHSALCVTDHAVRQHHHHQQHLCWHLCRFLGLHARSSHCHDSAISSWTRDSSSCSSTGPSPVRQSCTQPHSNQSKHSSACYCMVTTMLLADLRRWGTRQPQFYLNMMTIKPKWS